MGVGGGAVIIYISAQEGSRVCEGFLVRPVLWGGFEHSSRRLAWSLVLHPSQEFNELPTS